MQLELSTGGVQWIVTDAKSTALNFTLVGLDGSPDSMKVHIVHNISIKYTCY